MKDTSWKQASNWYDSIVGEQGHYYHQQVILPGVMELLSLQPSSRLLDIACGQGVLARHIPQNIPYVGIDGAKELIQIAKRYHTGQKNREFFTSDVTKPLPLAKDTLFTHATIILALQNIASMEKTFASIAPHLEKGAAFVIVLNHPAFRIPRQSSWGFDEQSKTQYRRLNCYMSPLAIPIISHPGRSTKESTSSFHFPVSHYINALANQGFMINGMQEWCSDKVSQGKAKTWENRARKEFPLFLALRAIKVAH